VTVLSKNKDTKDVRNYRPLTHYEPWKSACLAIDSLFDNMDITLKIGQGYRPPSTLRRLLAQEPPQKLEAFIQRKEKLDKTPDGIVICTFCKQDLDMDYHCSGWFCCEQGSPSMSLVVMLHQDYLTSETAMLYDPDTSWAHPAPIQYWDSNYQFHPIHILKKRLSADMASRALRIKNAHLPHSLSK